jgi:hypothetical protein
MTTSAVDRTRLAEVDPYDVIADDETLAEVFAALRRLDARSRHIIEATVLGDEPLTAVAARLGMSYQRVQQLRRCALEHLGNVVTHGYRSHREESAQRRTRKLRRGRGSVRLPLTRRSRGLSWPRRCSRSGCRSRRIH